MLDAFLEFVAASPWASALKTSRYVYPVVNAAHIMGLATLFGAILALDLRLVGAFPSVPARPLAIYLPRVAASGLLVAIVTGVLLFSVEPFDYADNPAFLAKLVIVFAGLVHAFAFRSSRSWQSLVRGEGEIDARIRLSGMLSLVLWAAAILAGRLIAF